MTRTRRGGGGRRRVWRTGRLLLVLPILAGTGGAGRADVCGACGPPTAEQLLAQPGFALERRTRFLSTAWDRVEMHAGECEIELSSPPRVRKASSWLVLRATGEVWNCPHSSSCDTMTATIGEEDSTQWTATAEASAQISFLGLALGAKLTKAVRDQVRLQRVTSLAKQVCAGDCRRIRWWGYFEVADLRATVEFEVSRRFAWWTKNILTGGTVWRSGEMWLDCGAGEAEFRARAPLAGYFRLRESPCADAECAPFAPRDLGFFPPLPGGEEEPVEEAEEEQGKDPPESKDLDEPPAGPSPDPLDEPDGPEGP